MTTERGSVSTPPVASQDTESDVGTLADELASRLVQAKSAQAKADALTNSIAGLEVDVIDADMNQVELPSGLSPDEAAAIGSLLARQRKLSAMLRIYGPGEPEEEDDSNLNARLREAYEALDLWLNAPTESVSKLPAHGARILLLAATIAALYGAWTWHPAVLALLVPVAAPIGLLLNRSDDRVWRRLGAKQRFERTKLPPPIDWEPDAVKARHEQVLEQIEAHAARLEAANAPVEDNEPVRTFGEISLEAVEVGHALESRAKRAGLDMEAMDATALNRLEAAGATSAARTTLRNQRDEKNRLTRESSDIRDATWRILNGRKTAIAGPLENLGTSSRFEDLESAIEALRRSHDIA
jgi:hypothetical protein